jgi:hypothetical protein
VRQPPTITIKEIVINVTIKFLNFKLKLLKQKIRRTESKKIEKKKFFVTVHAQKKKILRPVTATANFTKRLTPFQGLGNFSLVRE